MPYYPPAAAGGGGSLTVKEVDGTPSVASVTEIKVTNGSLTDNTGGSVSVVTGAGGGGSGSCVWLARGTASASAQLDFTGFISSTYDVYLFEFTNIIPATTAASFWMRMGTGGGPTYDAGANYSHHSLVWNGGGAAAGGANGANQIVLNYNNAADGISTGIANWTYNGQMRLYNPAGAAFKIVSGQVTYVDSAGGNRGSAQQAGAYESTTAVTAIRFLMSTGNITSGTIDVYGFTHA